MFKFSLTSAKYVPKNDRGAAIHEIRQARDNRRGGGSNGSGEAFSRRGSVSPSRQESGIEKARGKDGAATGGRH